MSNTVSKTQKRRKLEKNSNQDGEDLEWLDVQTVKNLSHLYNIQIEMPHVQPNDKLVPNSTDSTTPVDPTSINNICRSSNPYLAGQQCLLCQCERTDPIKETIDGEDDTNNTSALPQLPLWVCGSCQKSMEEVEKSTKLDSMASVEDEEREFTMESRALHMMAESRLSSVSESPAPAVSNTCHCTACSERRMIEADYQKETHELQKNWSELRQFIRRVYREGDPDCMPELEACEHHNTEPIMKALIHKLCHCDPHQLYRRLESQTREYILSKKVRLLRLLATSHHTPMETRVFVRKLLSVYHYLCVAATRLASLFRELEEEHLKRFKVTWELHDKHMFQSIVYMDPLIQSSQQTLINHLRQGATNEENAGDEESYSSVLRQFFKFENEMSVVCVVWRECHQYIVAYNDEQAALQVKQKMLKEDWEFFKQQRRLLEQVSKNANVLPKTTASPATLPVTCVNNTTSNTTSSSSIPLCTAGLEARFTETMRHIFQGKRSSDDRTCPRCSQKCCPCDECTITHMITCGIISPESVENTSSHHMPPSFLHNPTPYVIDVTPPSMSSSGSSSSGSSGPVELLAPPFDDYPESFQSCEDAADSQSGDDTTNDSKFADAETPQSPDFSDAPLPPDIGADSPDQIPVVPASVSVQNWVEATAQVEHGGAGETKACDCHHCITQTLSQSPSKVKALEPCQCHVCHLQRGSLVSTALPKDVPAMTRPAEFHLYPHIHGNHVSSPDHQSILHPPLYDLHGSSPTTHKTTTQSVSSSSKVPVKLDFDSPDGIQEHMYHAYSEWENTRLLIGTSHVFSATSKVTNNNVPDVIPQRPADSVFTTEAFQTLSQDPVLLAKFANRIMPSLIKGRENMAAAAAASSVPDQSLLYNAQSHVNTVQPISQINYHKPINTASNQLSTTSRVLDHGHLPSGKCILEHQHGTVTSQQPFCGARPTPIGGNTQHKMNISVPATTHDKTHCKHNLPGSNPPPHHNHVTNPTPSAISDKIRRQTPRRPIDPTQNSTINTTTAPHSCTHMRNNSTPNHTHPHPQNQCINAPPPPGSCPDVDCNGHPDDDSLDDSCSEKSSSTSTSNQKDGKYCDCCYCEFFGHSNPPSLPTSKNYAEMRDRLRQRLKKKNELKDTTSVAEPTKESTLPTYSSPDILDKIPGYFGDRDVDDIIQYINGQDEPKEQVASAKSAKRARQKQRKAEKKKGPEERDERAPDLSNTISEKPKPDDRCLNVENCVDDAEKRKKSTKKDTTVVINKCVSQNNILSDEMKIVTEKNLKNHQLVKDVKVEGIKKDSAKGKTKSPNIAASPLPKMDENERRDKSKEKTNGSPDDGKLRSVETPTQCQKNAVKNNKSQSPVVKNSPSQTRKDIGDMLVGVTQNGKLTNDAKSVVDGKGGDTKRDGSNSSKNGANDAKKVDASASARQAKSNSKIDTPQQPTSAKSTQQSSAKVEVQKSNSKVDVQQTKTNGKSEAQPKSNSADGRKHEQLKSAAKTDSQNKSALKNDANPPQKTKTNIDSKRPDVVQQQKSMPNDAKKVEKAKPNKEPTPQKSADNLPDLLQPFRIDFDKPITKFQDKPLNVTKPVKIPNGLVIDSPKNSRKKDRKPVTPNGQTNDVKPKNENTNKQDHVKTEAKPSPRDSSQQQPVIAQPSKSSAQQPAPSKPSNQPAKSQSATSQSSKSVPSSKATPAKVTSNSNQSVPAGKNAPTNNQTGKNASTPTSQNGKTSPVGKSAPPTTQASKTTPTSSPAVKTASTPSTQAGKMTSTPNHAVKTTSTSSSQAGKTTSTASIQTGKSTSAPGSQATKPVSNGQAGKALPNGQAVKIASTPNTQTAKAPPTPSVKTTNAASSPRLSSQPSTITRSNTAPVKSAVEAVLCESPKSAVPLSPRTSEALKAQSKNKRRNRKSKNQEDLTSVDEIFMPKTDSDLEGGDLDDLERELEEFKRFCFDCKPSAEDRVQVNVNLKDIFNKKKTGLGCS